MTADIPPYSPEAEQRLAALEAKKARGEQIGWADLAGILEPNPDLPDCPSIDGDSGVGCDLPNHHDGDHHAVVTW